jgi:nucleolar protein 56
MHRYWFGDVERRECRSCFWRDGGENVRRTQFFRVTGNTSPMPPVEWEMAAEAGIVRNREDYLHRLRELCICGARAQLEERAGRKDLELIEMVRVLDEFDRALNLLQEREDSWVAMLNPIPAPGSTSSDIRVRDDCAVARSAGVLTILQEEVRHLVRIRKQCARDVNVRAEAVLPNSSALVGGLVAARLLSDAGDLLTLATMPASALQVIGARSALFSHLQTRTPPPRHGIIYQDKTVHTAPRGRRGKVARAVACALGGAIKLDFFRGELAPEFIAKARTRIARARGGK